MKVLTRGVVAMAAVGGLACSDAPTAPVRTPRHCIVASGSIKGYRTRAQ